jgi:hypothetical protein
MTKLVGAFRDVAKSAVKRVLLLGVVYEAAMRLAWRSLVSVRLYLCNFISATIELDGFS